MSDPQIFQSNTRFRMQPEQRAEAETLHRALEALRETVVRQSDARLEEWLPLIRRKEFIASACNLADWLALRGMDLSAFQPALAALGLSTLGRLDGHVRPSLDAVIAALALISGQSDAYFPDAADIRAGEVVLSARRNEMFGGQEAGPATRVMVTLPTEAATDPALIEDLARQGVDCFRINCAHDSVAVWQAMIDRIRKAEAVVGRRLPVSMDLGGPKFRIDSVAGKKKEVLTIGDRFALVPTEKAARDDMPCAVLSHEALLAALQPGVRISIDDGKLWARVKSHAKGAAVLVVEQAPEKGVKLKPEKGVNLPGVDLRVAALTSDDLAALDFVTAHADLVAYSFVQTREDVLALLEAMAARAVDGRMPGVILKIETPLGLRNLPDLILQAGAVLPVGVMIARGDLAVEIGFDRLSEIQEEILWLCEAAQVPVVWATQVLETMVKDGQATRAEVTDAAMSQRAECVMLNKGPHIVQAVGFLRDILARMDRHQAKKRARLAPLHLWHQEAAAP